MKPACILFFAGLLIVSFNPIVSSAQKKLTQEMIDEYGTKTFTSDKTKMMDIIQSWLHD